MVRKGTGLRFPRSKSDQSGRWVITQCCAEDYSFTLCSVYGSILDDPTLFEWLNVELVGWLLPLIFCGDVNLNLDNGSGKIGGGPHYGRKPKVFKALSNLCNTHGLSDEWSILKPQDAGYTFFSAPHQTHARLDYFFVSQEILTKFNIIKSPRVMSDHNTLVLEITLQAVKLPNSRWTFNRAILYKDAMCNI